MCGIAGYAGGVRNPDALRRMADAQKRRGPDDEGFYESPGVGFAFRRLSIIDVEGGHQPVSNADESVWVMLNGEIYGYDRLRTELESKGYKFRTKSDSETIVHAYEEWGDDCFEHLNGMFAIAIWDDREKRLILARDRMGKKPLHYMEHDLVLWFASEIKALLAANVVKKKIDPVAVGLYFESDHIPTPRTIFEGVKKLEPASALAWKNGRIEKQWTFWQIEECSDERIGSRDAVPLLRREIDLAVRDRLVSDVPLGIFLSGGLDSAVIAESAARQSSNTLRAYTIGFEDASHDETDAARIVADRFGLDHHVETLTSSNALHMIDEAVACLDEPLADAAILPQLLLARFARRDVTVAVAGDGGDELLLGYQHVPAHAFAIQHPKIWSSLRFAKPIANIVPAGSGYFSSGFKLQRLARGLGITDSWKRDIAWRGSWNSDDLASFLLPEVREHAVLGSASAILARYGRELPESCPFWNQWSYAYLRTFLMDQVMVKVDRATMWMSLEARAPFLDQRVVEASFRIPNHLKLGVWKGKRLFAELLREKLPQDILSRSKHGFGVPVGEWLNGPLSNQLTELSHPALLAEQHLFDPAVIARIIAEHRAGRIDRRKELWSYYMFQRWYQAWIR